MKTLWISFARVASALTIAACSAAPDPKSSKASDASKATTALQLKAGTEITLRANVRAIDLDGIGFRIDMFRVGLQSFMSSESPVLSFTIPAQGDYLEIMRCRADAQDIAELRNAYVGVANNEALTRIVNNVNFWKGASESRACVLLATSVSSGTYYDGGAPSGSHVYLARACVSSNRLIGSASLGNRNCSAQVTPSTELEAYTNKRTDLENQAVTQMGQALAEADGMGRQIYDLTIEYNNSLVKCEKNKSRNNASAQRFKGISTLLGVGSSLGYTLLTESPANTTVSQIWNARDSVVNRGLEIAGVLQSLYTNPSDYLTECRPAEGVQEKAKVASNQLKAAQERYVQYQEAATTATAQRQQLESH